MATYKELADAIIQQEGAFDQRSVNMRMVTQQGLWNVGHLVWASQRGAVPVSIGGRLWAGWPTYEDSYDGLLRQLRAYANQGLTLEQMIYKYAPPKENLTESYIAFVGSRTGIPRDGRLADYLDPNSYFQYAGRKANETPAPDQPFPLDLGTGEEAADSGVELAALGGAAGIFLLLAIAGTAAVLLKRP
jgi:hypothetical protein